MAFVEGDGFDCQSGSRLSEKDLAACCLGIVLIMTAAVGRPSLLRAHHSLVSGLESWRG